MAPITVVGGMIGPHFSTSWIELRLCFSVKTKVHSLLTYHIVLQRYLHMVINFGIPVVFWRVFFRFSFKWTRYDFRFFVVDLLTGSILLVLIVLAKVLNEKKFTD